MNFCAKRNICTSISATSEIPKPIKAENQALKIILNSIIYAKKTDLTNSTTIYSEIELINKLVFKLCGIKLTNIETQAESQDYFAHTFQLDGQKVQFRTAKITPTKSGQFVSIWKRNKQGITEPFNISDEFDLYIIATRHNQKFGLFIFSKTILLENKILSDTKKVGKRGIRVYPTWDETTNKQAQKTQHWQTKYFLEITQGNQINTAIVRSLCKLNKQ